VVAIEEDGDVNVDNISLSQRSAVWDAMADALVNTGAYTLGEVSIVEGGGVGSSFYCHGVHSAINLVRGDAGLDEGASVLEDSSC